MPLQATKFDLRGSGVSLTDDGSTATSTPTIVQTATSGGTSVTLTNDPVVGNTLFLFSTWVQGAIADPAGWTVVHPGFIYRREVQAGDGKVYPIPTSWSFSYPGDLVILEVSGAGSAYMIMGGNYLPGNATTLSGSQIITANALGITVLQRYLGNFSSVSGGGSATLLNEIYTALYYWDTVKFTTTGTLTFTFASASQSQYTWTMVLTGPNSTPYVGISTWTGTGSAITNRVIGGPAYTEFAFNPLATGTHRVGVSTRSLTLTSLLGADANGVGYDQNGNVYINGAVVATLAAWTVNDRVAMCVHPTKQKVWFKVNGGNWNNDILANQDPANGIGGISISFAPANLVAAAGCSGLAQVYIKSPSTSWLYSAPSGYSELATFQAITPATIEKSIGAAWKLSSLTWNVTCGKWTADKYRYKVYSPGNAASLGGAETYVRGVVSEAGAAVSGRLVALYDARNMQLLGYDYSAPATGAFAIHALGRSKVFAVAFDPTSYRALAYDNITPQ